MGRDPAKERRVTRELHLAGTGSFAVEVAEWAEDAAWSVVGLIELLDSSRVGTLVAGRPVVADDCPASGAPAVIAIGGERRGHSARLQRLGWDSAAVLHPRAHVSSSATISAGVIVAPGAIVGAEAVVGEHVLISRGALVGHHAQIGSFTSLLPGANVGGHVKLDDGVTVGMGSVIVNGVKIGTDATVAAGAVVLTDVGAGSRVQGVPAREYNP
jgi:sugar O-acyltransferase (sialic acid O-acetyltransferase NeuD family)